MLFLLIGVNVGTLELCQRAQQQPIGLVKGSKFAIDMIVFVKAIREVAGAIEMILKYEH